MNEFITDVKKPVQIHGDWIPSPAGAVGRETGDETPSPLKRGEEKAPSARMRAVRHSGVLNALLPGNPYPSVMAGIGAGALLGFLVAWRFTGRSV